MSWLDENGALVAGRKPGSPSRSRPHADRRACAMCGGLFWVQHCQIRRVKRGGTYCSRTCKYRGMRGVELVTGTRYLRKDGYVSVKVGIRKQDLEHRVVMEHELGRSLTAAEHVHHINGDKQDNRPENLQVLTNAEHQRLHLALGDSGLCCRRAN